MNDSRQAIAREARQEILNALDVPKWKSLGYDPLNAAERVDKIILAAIERSHDEEMKQLIHDAEAASERIDKKQPPAAQP